MNTLLSNPEFVTVLVGLIAAISLLIKNYADTLSLKKTTQQTQKTAEQTQEHVTNGTLADQIAKGIAEHQRQQVMLPTIPQEVIDFHKRLHEQ